MNSRSSARSCINTRCRALALIALATCLGAPAWGAAVNVLWYTYSDPTSEYRSSIASLAASVTTYPDNPSGNTWNLSYFGPGDSPSFSGYDVLVIHSGEAWRTQPAGQPPPYATPDYSGILGNRAAIVAARGSRTFITGSDADFHAIREDTGNTAPDNADGWDGAIGHVVNAINWAADGSGLNVVSFYDGEFPGAFWWLNEDSFLRDELSGFAVTPLRDETPVIADPLHPLNAGLSDLGLSHWSISFHGGFSAVPPGYFSVVNSTASPGAALAIASAVIPLPAGALLYLSAWLAAIWLRRR